MFLIYLPPVLFSIFFVGMCSFYYITYLSLQEVYIQLIVGFVVLCVVLSTIQVIRFGPGFVDKSIREELDAKLFNDLQEELKSLMTNEDKLFEILEQNQQTEQLTEEQLIHIINIKVQDSNGITICKLCKSYKPLRAHHCSQCKQCVFRMDHHCMWLNLCIGLKNYKYFLMLLLYLNLCFILVLITYFATYIQAIHESDSQLLIKFTYYHSIVLLFLLFFPFFLHHLRLAMNNQTTIEYYKYKEKTNPFYKDLWNNLKEILGYEWYYWLLPI